MQYDAVLLDLDGTLIDTSNSIITCAQEAMETCGIPIPPEADWGSFVGPPLQECFQIVCGVNDRETLDRLASAYIGNFSDRHIALGGVYPGMVDMLHQLRRRGVKTAVATLKHYTAAQKTVGFFGLDRYFDIICGTNGQDVTKKHHTMTKALNFMGVSPDRALMVGDSPYDQMGADTLGCDFAAALYGYGYRNIDPADIPARYKVNCVKELHDQLMGATV